MSSFKQHILTETFVNLFQDDVEQRERYKHEVFNMLTAAYKQVGGLKTRGLKDPDDMVANIPFWKLARSNGKIVAGVMYKDKGGRKSVASFTDGTKVGIYALVDIKANELDRSISELSDKALQFMIRTVGISKFKKYAIEPSRVKGITGDDITTDGVDQKYIDQYPELAQYFYAREIKGQKITKIMVGTPGKHITRL